MSITTKKIQLIPMGDREEKDRVYKYLKDAIYNQHHILNTYMSQMGCVYYKYNKDIKNADYKEEVKAIFRNTNTAIYDMPQAKGLGMAGNCGMRVKKDFSTALKNGLAKGERNLPFYKRNYPLLAPSRFLRFYTTKEEFMDDGGIFREREIYAIKFVNGINFKVVIGGSGKRDWFLPSLLNSIISEPDNYHVCDSKIQIVKGGKLILNLTVKINKEIEKYEPVKGRVMGLALGYDKCLTAALSDSDEVFTIGDNLKESIVEKRIQIQEYNRSLQKSLRYTQGGHGRNRKLRKFNERGSYESNIVRNFNHILSNQVVEFAQKHKVETIIIEDVNKDMLEAYPVLLRNWSYYQLTQFITYKAERTGSIIVKTSESKDAPRIACCKCGCKLEDKDIIPKEIEWCNELSFICPSCNEQIDYSYNKAKNMTILG